MTETAVIADAADRRWAGIVALAIPTLNEEAAIADAVRAIPRDVVGRIIVADGGSTDATAARARAAGADVIEAGRGYGRACLAAATAAEGADIVVFMDGDGADDPAHIAALVAPIRAGAFPAASPGTNWRRGTSPASACGFSTACVTPTCARSGQFGATCCCASA
jgi:glycosyltransferase involved in cell wall biosynthesis